MPVQFTTPVGRIVWGHPQRPIIRKDQNKNPVIRDGKQVEQWSFGLAIPKQEFMEKVWPFLQQEAASAFPNGVPPQFAWKFKDGDGVDRQGKPFSAREGYAGCYVLTISTEAFAPPMFKFENGVYRPLVAEEVECGYYAAVTVASKFNGASGTNTPGLYMNPLGILLVGYGPQIMSSGADPDELFKGQTFALPPGASAMPMAPVTTVPGAASPNAYAGAAPGMPPVGMPNAGIAAPMPSGMPMQPQYAPAYPQQPQPAMTGYTQPVAPMPAPAHDFVHNAGQPVYAPAPHPMPTAQPMTGYAPAVAGMPGMPAGR